MPLTPAPVGSERRRPLSAGLRVGGVRLEIHASSLLLLTLLAILLATSFFPFQEGASTYSTAEFWALGVASSVLLLVSVLLHELAHFAVSRAFGLRVDRITLFFHAGHSPGAEEAPTPGRDFVIAAVGPVATLALAGLGWIGWLLWPETRHVAPLLKFLTVTNALLGLAHLMPGHPFDGARAVGAVAWRLTGNRHEGTRWAARLAQAFALALAAACSIGIAGSGLATGWTWGLMLASALWLQGVVMARVAQQRRVLEGRVVADVMSPPPPALPRVLSVAEALLQIASTRGVPHGWLVESQGRLGATVSLRDLRSVPPDERFQTPVGQVARRLEQQHVVSPRTRLEAAVRILAKERLALLPVVHEGRVVGVLTREAVASLMTAPHRA